jgi:hypothetical protein
LDGDGEGEEEGTVSEGGLLEGNVFGMTGAWRFGSVKKGRKFTVPKLKSFLES